MASGISGHKCCDAVQIQYLFVSIMVEVMTCEVQRLYCSFLTYVIVMHWVYISQKSCMAALSEEILYLSLKWKCISLLHWYIFFNYYIWHNWHLFSKSFHFTLRNTPLLSFFPFKTILIHSFKSSSIRFLSFSFTFLSFIFKYLPEENQIYI